MYRAELRSTVEAPWLDLPPIRVGEVPTALGTPGGFVTVERDGLPFARIDVWPLAAGPFTRVEVWGGLVVIGWNDHAHLVDPLAREVTSIECDGYFGHLYPAGDRLLVADASRLTCVNARRERLWTSGSLGVDGVIVDDVRDGVIVGRGEWDPPGGWRPFELSLVSGLAP